jgi:hypothetical protein
MKLNLPDNFCLINGLHNGLQIVYILVLRSQIDTLSQEFKY